MAEPIPYPVLPSGGELAVASTDDVLAAFPPEARDIADAPVQGALVEAMLDMYLAHQQAADYAAAQSDATRATGMYLRGLAGDRLVYAEPDEDNEALRDRLFATPDVVTPAAILAAVNAVLAPHTSREAKLFESILDSLFVEDGTATWHAFVHDGLVDLGPDYPDRLYAQRPQYDPGGAWVFADNEGRFFILRVPDLSGVTDAIEFVIDEATDGDGLFLVDGDDPEGFVFADAQTALEIYQAIINTVERLRGHGIRWKLVVDATL